MHNVSFHLFDREVVLGSPTVGQFLEVENLKNIYAYNSYDALLRTNTLSAQYTVDLVNMMAILTAMAREALKPVENLKGGVKNYSQLTFEEGAEMVKVYRKHIKPFWQELEKLMAEVLTDEPRTPEEQEVAKND